MAFVDRAFKFWSSDSIYLFPKPLPTQHYCFKNHFSNFLAKITVSTCIF